MTLFTDNPLEKMMIQRPGDGRRENAPPVPIPGVHGLSLQGSPLWGYCLKQADRRRKTPREQ